MSKRTRKSDPKPEGDDAKPSDKTSAKSRKTASAATEPEAEPAMTLKQLAEAVVSGTITPSSDQTKELAAYVFKHAKADKPKKAKQEKPKPGKKFKDKAAKKGNDKTPKVKLPKASAKLDSVS